MIANHTGVSKSDADGNRTRNLRIDRQTPVGGKNSNLPVIHNGIRHFEVLQGVLIWLAVLRYLTLREMCYPVITGQNSGASIQIFSFSFVLVLSCCPW